MEWDGPWECEDWGYAPDWSALSHPLTPSSRAKNAADFVRRRRWVRRRRQQQQQQEAPGATPCQLLPCGSMTVTELWHILQGIVQLVLLVGR